MNKRAVGYIRVSTDKQKSEGVSLDAQRTRIEAMGTAQGASLLSIIEDDESAKSLDRPGIRQIMKMVSSRLIDMVIVFKLDRLTRSIVDLDTLTKHFAKFDVSLVSLSESLDTGSASGRMVMNILTTISQWERETICERTKFAMRHKKTNRQAYNHTPYGFDRVDDRLVPRENEMSTVQFILTKRAEGLAIRRIAYLLNVQNIPSKKGGSWHVSAIANILKNRELYE